MTAQHDLVSLVKIKGVGKTMSKSLSPEQLDQASTLLLDTSTEDATKATLLVAFLMLENTPEEQHWFNILKTHYKTRVPQACYFLFDSSIMLNSSSNIFNFASNGLFCSLLSLLEANSASGILASIIISANTYLS